MQYDDPDDFVFRAQRDFGAFLRPGPKADQEQGLSRARQSYATLLTLAEGGEAAACDELIRILGEPDSIRQLQIDPHAVLAALPTEMLAPACRRSAVRVDDVVALLAAREDIVTRDSLEEVAIDRARDEGRRDLLVQIAESGTPANAATARALLGGFHPADIAALRTPNSAEPEAWLAVTRQCLAGAESWLEDPRTKHAAPTRAADIRRGIDELARIRDQFEAQFLSQCCDELFRSKVTNLRWWEGRVEHIMRRIEFWLASPHEPTCSEFVPALEQRLTMLREHAMTWGRRYAQARPAFFVRAQVPSSGSPLPLCPYCGSWFQTTARFCGQCGAEIQQPAGVSSEQAEVPWQPVFGGSAPSDRWKSSGASSRIAQTTNEIVVGGGVQFRAGHPRRRIVRDGPAPDARIVEQRCIGRWEVLELVGEWVFMRHPTGPQGWARREDVQPI